MPLDDYDGHAPPREEYGRGQTDQASADDQHRRRFEVSDTHGAYPKRN
jgi:hypothetical protein